MPDFVPTYAPANGAPLSSTGLNQNLYRITSGRAIYEIGNGHIESVNFDPAFEVQPHHVRPGQAGEALSVGQVIPNDYFSDLWLGSGAGYLGIVGAAVTFHQKYDVGMALFAASGFMSCWRQFGPSTVNFSTRAAAPDIHVKAYIQSSGGNITFLDHTQRELPQTVHFNSASADPVAEIAIREQRLTRHFNLAHPRMRGGPAQCGPLLAGWHTFGLACFVEQNISGQDTTRVSEDMKLNLNGAGTDARDVTFYSAIHRLRLYCRSVTAMRLL